MDDFRPLHIATPLLLHPGLSTPSRKIWLKLENLQPSGSFKMRGLGALCVEAVRDGKSLVVCPSGGNAGYAAAMAAQALGIAAQIVVPNTTPQATRERIAAIGATVTVHGDVWEQSNDYAIARCQSVGAAYIPAFDHPTIWAGNSTVIDEIVATLPNVDAVVASVGGGGLLMGVLTGLQRHGRMDRRVIACETEGAASFHAARQAGHAVSIGAITSIAKSLGALKVAERVVETVRDFHCESVVLPDRDAVTGVVRFADDFRQLVEPACGVSLATAYLDHPALDGCENVVVIVCGGVSISADQVVEWRKQYLETA